MGRRWQEDHPQQERLGARFRQKPQAGTLHSDPPWGPGYLHGDPSLTRCGLFFSTAHRSRWLLGPALPPQTARARAMGPLASASSAPSSSRRPWGGCQSLVRYTWQIRIPLLGLLPCLFRLLLDWTAPPIG